MAGSVIAAPVGCQEPIAVPRISAYDAGLTGRFSDTQGWKRLRVTPHDHNPSMTHGQREAFRRIQDGAGCHVQQV